MFKEWWPVSQSALAPGAPVSALAGLILPRPGGQSRSDGNELHLSAEKLQRFKAKGGGAGGKLGQFAVSLSPIGHSFLMKMAQSLSFSKFLKAKL